MIFLTSIFLFLSAWSQGIEHEVHLSNNQLVWKTKSNNLMFFQKGNKQYLESQDSKSGKKIQNIQVWSGILKGELSRMSTIYSSKKFEVFKLYGMSDGNSRFYEIVAWDPKTGKMHRLLSTFNYDVFSMTKGTSSLVFSLIQIDENAHNEHIHVNVPDVEKVCKHKLAKLRLLEREKWSLLKKNTRESASAKTNRINQIEAEKDKYDLSNFTFDLSNFAKVQASCD